MGELLGARERNNACPITSPCAPTEVRQAGPPEGRQDKLDNMEPELYFYHFLYMILARGTPWGARTFAASCV